MFDQNTTMLWDAVAVYLAYSESLLKMERLPIHIKEDGRMTVSPRGPVLRVATGAGTGLAATYYNNADFTGTTVVRTDPTVNFDWASGSPAVRRKSPCDFE